MYMHHTKHLMHQNITIHVHFLMYSAIHIMSTPHHMTLTHQHLDHQTRAC